jgi:hypothetical protein
MKRSGVRLSSEQSRNYQDRASDGADMHETGV